MVDSKAFVMVALKGYLMDFLSDAKWASLMVEQ